jgi:hypothetical protein
MAQESLTSVREECITMMRLAAPCLLLIGPNGLLLVVRHLF